jgi:hypothetical protein
MMFAQLAAAPAQTDRCTALDLAHRRNWCGD